MQGVDMGALGIMDWFDAAWAALYWDVPGGFTNPYEYREMMYSLIFNGEMPEKFRQQQAQSRAKELKGYREKRRSGGGSETPKSAIAGLMAMQERARELQAAKQAE